jgi:hypothetical protein
MDSRLSGNEVMAAITGVGLIASIATGKTINFWLRGAKWVADRSSNPWVYWLTTVFLAVGFAIAVTWVIRLWKLN